MDFELNGWILLFLMVGSQGLLISLLIFWRQKNRVWLGGAVLAYSILLFYYTAFWSGLLTAWPSWAGLIMGFPYVISGFMVMQLGHYPSRIALRLLIPYFLYVSFFLISQIMQLPGWAHGVQAAVQCLIVLSFGAFAYKITTTRLEQYIAILFLGFGIAHTSYYILLWMNQLTLQSDYFVSLAGAVFMYGSAYLSFFYKEPVTREPLQSKMRNMLIERIEEDKLYLDNELRLPALAETTGFSTHQISELINSGGENFADLINKYRVKEAMQILSNPASGHMTTEEIGYASGFNNKTSFYKHFKKNTGLSPMKYRMKHAKWLA